MQIGIVLVAVHMRCNHNKWGMLLTRSVEEILRHVMSNVQATFHDSRKRYAMKNRCLSFKMCRFPCGPVFFLCWGGDEVLYIRCVLWGVFLSFFRHLVQLHFVSCRVAASFVLWFSWVSFRFVSTRRVSFPFVSPLRSSSRSVAFRFVPCRRVVETKKETNKEKQQTNPNSYQPLAGPMNS